MNEENYSFENGIIQIKDPEMQISIEIPFEPQLLPELTENDFGKGVKITRDEEGHIEEAYIEKNGFMDGQYRLYYPSGSIKGEAYYLLGELHGPSSYYNEQGSLLAISWYVKGKQEGKTLQYYASGNLYSRQRYYNGEWHGLQEYYYEDGAKKTIMPYVHGRLHGQTLLYHDNGNLKREINFVDGKRKGVECHWNSDGLKSHKCVMMAIILAIVP